MRLFTRVVGSGRPLVLLHGLFGSGDNWLTVARRMLGVEVHLPDLRNHGQSGWDDAFDRGSLAADLGDYLAEHGLERAVLAGHSLGAKVVMEHLLQGSPASGAVFLDMAPRAYLPQYVGFFEAMRSLDLDKTESRAQARELLAPAFPDAATLAFALKSLVPDEARPGRWRWRLNLQALANHYDEIWKEVPGGRQWDGQALFLSGSASDYVSARDLDLSLDLFPNAQFHAIAGAGHWLHADRPEAVLGELRRWLTEALDWELPEWT